MALAGFGRLGLWLHLRGGPGASHNIALPDGTGPLLILCASEPCHIAVELVTEMLIKSQPRMRILDLGLAGLADPDTDSETMQQLLDRARPFAVLLLGTDLPAALITAAVHRNIPVVLGEAALNPRELRWTLTAGMRRDLMTSLTMIFATDSSSHETARRIGVAPQKVTTSGPVTESFDPLPCNEVELSTIADLLNGRHSWLATCVPESEEEAVLAAHLAALRQVHRTLLFLVPETSGRIAPLVAMFEANGLIVAQRSLDEDPLDDVQVFIAESVEELGLWYRLAPVTYIGGTLSGDDSQTRNPFEPAALGSAIVHGPETGQFATAWQQLDGAEAARRVSDPRELATAIAEMTLPELVAGFANNAWDGCTGGAGVATQIASYMLDLANEGTP